MSLPRKIYNVAAKWRPLKRLMNATITTILPRSVKLEEGTLWLNPNDPALSSMVLFGVFEPYTTFLFRKQLRDGQTVIDIGANVGYYTLIAAKRVGQQGRVFAFEPDLENVAIVRKNIEINNLRNVSVITKGVSNQTGNAILYMSDDNKCTHAIVKNREGEHQIQIETITIDESIKQARIGKVSIIKMDIEGAETLALEGMKETLLANPDICIFSEFYPAAIRRLDREPIDFLKEFSRYGFSIWVIDEDKKKLLPLELGQFEEYIESFPKDETVSNLYIKNRDNTHFPWHF